MLDGRGPSQKRIPEFAKLEIRKGSVEFLFGQMLRYADDDQII